ncbi:hypothetical protein BH11MYX4_BH11MYX4_44770 [soil metagenome]
MSPCTPDLQRKEARPSGALIFLWALFLLPIGTCGGIGTSKLLQAREPVVRVTSPAMLTSERDVKMGAYVEADLDLTLVARDELPLGDGYAAVARGFRAYAVEGAPNVVVLSSEALASGPVEGQICEADAHLACSLPRKELDAYVRSLQRARRTPVRVLLAHARPGDTSGEAAIGLGVAGFVLLAALLTSLQLVRLARRAGLVVLSRTLTLRHPPEQVRARIRAQAGPLHRIAHDAPDRMVVLLGKPAGSARLSGAREPDEIPLRVDLELGAADAYRGTSASIHVLELLNRPPAALAKVLPSDPSRLAAERAAAWISAACEGG